LHVNYLKVFTLVYTHLIARLMIVGPKAMVYSYHIICNNI